MVNALDVDTLGPTGDVPNFSRRLLGATAFRLGYTGFLARLSGQAGVFDIFGNKCNKLSPGIALRTLR